VTRAHLLAPLAAAALAVAALAAGAALPASGSSGTQGSEGTPSSNCPSPNPPNEMQLAAGTPQSATLGSAFATALQVVLVNSNGCAVTGAAGTPVTFTAPASGASGIFSGSGSSAVTVGVNSQGDATAPSFSANQISGSYAVSAASSYGSASFSLTNSASGVPARLLPVSPLESAATVLGHYAAPLQARVLDANGAPLAGISVTFTLTPASGTNACGGTESAGASFTGGSSQANATTNASGLATSPPLSANGDAGTVAASAAVSSSSSASASASASSYPAPAPLSFSLKNLPGKPRKLTAGVGASQSTTVGGRFAIRLAVSVTDAQKNPVAGALVTFSAPASGASGSFVVRSRHRSRSTRHVKVRSDACGVALAPPFSANHSVGGYVVKARVAHARPAAFGLVNRGT
jgi:hypothetical protein